MTSPKEHPASIPNADYHQAERMIDRAIAGMDPKTHIEYGSTMERKNKQPFLKKWLQWLRRLNA